MLLPSSIRFFVLRWKYDILGICHFLAVFTIYECTIILFTFNILFLCWLFLQGWSTKMTENSRLTLIFIARFIVLASIWCTLLVHTILRLLLSNNILIKGVTFKIVLELLRRLNLRPFIERQILSLLFFKGTIHFLIEINYIFMNILIDIFFHLLSLILWMTFFLIRLDGLNWVLIMELNQSMALKSISFVCLTPNYCPRNIPILFLRNPLSLVKLTLFLRNSTIIQMTIHV